MTPKKEKIENSPEISTAASPATPFPETQNLVHKPSSTVATGPPTSTSSSSTPVADKDQHSAANSSASNHTSVSSQIYQNILKRRRVEPL